MVDTRSKSVVMFSRIYDKHAHKICREEAVPGSRNKPNMSLCSAVGLVKRIVTEFCRMLLVEFEKLQLPNYFQTN